MELKGATSLYFLKRWPCSTGLSWKYTPMYTQRSTFVFANSLLNWFL